MVIISEVPLPEKYDFRDTVEAYLLAIQKVIQSLSGKPPADLINFPPVIVEGKVNKMIVKVPSTDHDLYNVLMERYDENSHRRIFGEDYYYFFMES